MDCNNAITNVNTFMHQRNDCLKSWQLVFVTLFLCVLLRQQVCCHDSKSSTKVSIEVATPPISCTNGKETLHLDLVTSKDKSNRKISLFLDNTQISLNLIYDKINPHFNVYQTYLNQYNISRTDYISESIFYKRESSYPKQFKSISEFYGTVEGYNNQTAFVRVIVQFVDCSRIFLFGFINHNSTLYQIRPLLNNLKEDFRSQSLKPIHYLHEIVEVVTKLDGPVFTTKSMAIQNHFDFNDQMLSLKRTDPSLYSKKKSFIENKYCLIDIRTDKSFYQLMNKDFHQVVVYIQSVFMLANEILKNIEWENEQHNLFGFALHHINVNHSFGDTQESKKEFDKDKLHEELLAIEPDTRKSECLLHLFTAKQIKDQADGKYLKGMSNPGAMYSIGDNVGVTSISDCTDDPWKFKCMLTFVHEIAHSMGAVDDDVGGEDDDNDEQYLMAHDHNEDIGHSKLTLSVPSIEDITGNTFDRSEIDQRFINATGWSLCGNGIVEQGEECDEGDAELCCTKCHLKGVSQCSPYNALCCDQKCQFKQSGPCMPWNYCNDRDYFCANSEVYCRPDRINVRCEKILLAPNGKNNKQNQMDENPFFQLDLDQSIQPTEKINSIKTKNNNNQNDSVDSNQLLSQTIVMTLFFIIVFVATIITIAMRKFTSYNAITSRNKSTDNAEQNWVEMEIQPLNNNR